MSSDNVLKLIKEHDVKFVDLRFCDTIGKEQHVTVPASVVDKEMLKEGKMFDGSSIAGWKSIDESDMILMPETESAVIDPFFDDATLNIRCDVVEP
jgi:glutamine synthetase